jgi:hypothetical protein
MSQFVTKLKSRDTLMTLEEYLEPFIDTTWRVKSLTTWYSFPDLNFYILHDTVRNEWDCFIDDEVDDEYFGSDFIFNKNDFKIVSIGPQKLKEATPANYLYFIKVQRNLNVIKKRYHEAKSNK